MSLPPQLRKVADTIWELPTSYKSGMRVPARIIATESLLGGMEAKRLGVSRQSIIKVWIAERLKQAS